MNSGANRTTTNNSDAMAEPVPFARISRNDPPYVVGGANGGFKYVIANRVTISPTKQIPDPYTILRFLPETADKLYASKQDDKKHRVRGWTTPLKMLLSGVYEETKKSSLSMLRGNESTILREIYEYVSNDYARHVKLTIPAALVGNADDSHLLNFAFKRRDNNNIDDYIMPYVRDIKPVSFGFQDAFVAFSKCGQVDFPKPNDRMVTMMPFVLGDKFSLPEDLQCYFSLIEQCPYMLEEVGSVAYLTVHESCLEPGETQRKLSTKPRIMPPGLFREDPRASSFTPGVEHPWGMNQFFGPDRYEGGIYCASNVKDAIKVWDAVVDKTVPGVVSSDGSCGHFRRIIGKGTKLKAGELIWMTDATPRAEVPPEGYSERQFFQVVMPIISRWYEGRWTPNPMVRVPAGVKVIREGESASATR